MGSLVTQVSKFPLEDQIPFESNVVVVEYAVKTPMLATCCKLMRVTITLNQQSWALKKPEGEPLDKNFN